MRRARYRVRSPSGHILERDPLDLYISFVDLVQTEEAVQKHGRTAARWAHNGDRLTALNGQVYASKRVGLHFAGVVAFDDIDGLDHCRIDSGLIGNGRALGK